MRLMRLESQLTKIARGATPTEILQVAGLDWTVQKCPRYFEYEGSFKEVPGKYSLVRTDKGIELDICTERWQEQQNIETIELAYKAFESQNIEISYAGAINGSRSIALLADWKKDTNVGKPSVGDIVDSKIMIIGSHIVGVGHQIRMYLNRLVCSNGMTMPVLKARKIIAHTTDAIKIIEKALENAESNFNSFKENADRLTETSIDYVEAQALLIKDFGYPNLSISEQPRLVKIVLDLFDGKGQGSDLLTSYNTAWGLLNAMTSYYSHSQYSRSKDRLNSLIQGTAYNNTQTLQNSLLKYASSRENSVVRQPVLL